MKQLLLCTLCTLLAGFSVQGCSKKPEEDKPREKPAVKKEDVGSGKKKDETTTKIVKPRLSFETGREGGLFGLSISADGKLVMGQTIGEKDSIQIWDLDKKERKFTFSRSGGSIVPELPTAFSPGGKFAAYVSQSPPDIVLIDLSSGKQLRRLRKKDGDLSVFMRCLYFSPKGDDLVVVSGHEVVGWDPNKGDQRFAWKEKQEITALSPFFDGGKKIATGYKSKRDQVKIWNVKAGEPIQTLSDDKVDDNQVQDIAVSSDGKVLATRHTLGKVQIWDMASGKIVKEAEPSPDSWSNLLFLPGSKTIAFGGGEFGKKVDKIYLVNVDSGKPTHRLDGHTESITSLAVTPDGGTLVSASKDKTIKVWDLK